MLQKKNRIKKNTFSSNSSSLAKRTFRCLSHSSWQNPKPFNSIWDNITREGISTFVKISYNPSDFNLDTKGSTKVKVNMASAMALDLGDFLPISGYIDTLPFPLDVPKVSKILESSEKKRFFFKRRFNQFLKSYNFCEYMYPISFNLLIS